MAKTRVLVIDDSALIRQILTEILNRDPAIEVVGVASDPYIARDKIKQLNPDVLTLDVEMPRMDGISFLSNLMRLRPMPVVMVSSLTEAGADITLQALEIGAVDFVAKPKLDVAQGLEEYAEEITAKVKAAGSVQIASIERRQQRSLSTAGGGTVACRTARQLNFKTTEMLIAVGASTGGTEAIKAVLERMPPDAPGMVITQHIPKAFSRQFADRMNRSSEMTVAEAQNGIQILPGHAYIAPGDRHLRVERSGARFVCRLDDGPLVNRHKPSVDVLFHSVAENIGRNAIGAILTGMGDDGAKGLMEMKEAGASTVVQDEKTSVVWGMPGSAVKLGAAEKILPLDEIADVLLELASQHQDDG